MLTFACPDRECDEAFATQWGTLIMINRTIIRLKVVQLLYACQQRGTTDIPAALRELHTSLDKARELYCSLLILVVNVTRFAREVLLKKEELNRVMHKEETLSHRFIDNALAKRLATDEELSKLREKGIGSWTADAVYLKQLLANLQEQPAYIEYINKGEEPTFEDDQQLWRKLYKGVIAHDERLDELIEEQSIYWNDDKAVIDTFVLKTLKLLEPAPNPDSPTLLPPYKEETDKNFAEELFRQALTQETRWAQLIAERVTGWEFNRLALMDRIIMQAALAEIVTIPLIPVEVSINEYVEIAKYYSTPKSSNYINGILDHLARRLRQDGVILKDF